MKASGVSAWLFHVSMVIVLAGSLFGTGVRELCDSPSDSRALTGEQMTATFGDGTDPCKKSYSCRTAFKSGGSDCGFCGSNPSRTVCCNIGSETACEYQIYGGAACFSGTTFWVGALNASGPCETCSALSYRPSGNCDGIRNATDASGSCP
jgi:hypothetical protein